MAEDFIFAGDMTEGFVEVNFPTIAGDMAEVESSIEGNFQLLKNLFPNADPEYLEQVAIECEHDHAALQTQIDEMLAPNASYPTLDDQIRNKKNQEIVSFYTKSFNVEEYLKKFPNRNPREYFSKVKTTGNIGKSHVDHSLYYLSKKFPCINMDIIEKRLVSHKYCLVDTVFDLQKSIVHCCNRRKTSLIKKIEPKEVNTAFLQEVSK